MIREARDPVEVAGPLGTPLGLAQRQKQMAGLWGFASLASIFTLCIGPGAREEKGNQTSGSIFVYIYI